MNIPEYPYVVTLLREITSSWESQIGTCESDVSLIPYLQLNKWSTVSS
jgi:hypothetical protein